jgi:Protein of unknown function (DUF4256)
MVDKVGVIERIKTRFESRVAKDGGPSWADILLKIESNPDKLKSFTLMEETGGEPAFVWVNKNGNFVFCDCSKETPTGRRSLCYDEASRLSRKSFAPNTSAIEMAQKIGAQILDEENYRRLQEEVGEFDLKTSSWILTPNNIRDLGGALFADRRYGEVFVYHNGAESYYASRGFRCMLEI